MTTDAFTTAARTEGRPTCEHHWVSHGQDSALIPWVIRCDLCGALNTAEMERAARAHLAAQEPTDEEVEAAAISLSRPLIGRNWHLVSDRDRGTFLQDARAALSAARDVRGQG